MGIRIPQSNVLSSVADEAITKEMHDGLGRATLCNENEEPSLIMRSSSKQGRMIEKIDEDENVNLVKSSKQGEAHDKVGHKIESDDTEVVDFSTASPQNDDDEVNLS
ncbi:hypothetical protein Tco_0914006 [Tanacetum coccineum]